MQRRPMAVASRHCSSLSAALSRVLSLRLRLRLLLLHGCYSMLLLQLSHSRSLVSRVHALGPADTGAVVHDRDRGHDHLESSSADAQQLAMVQGHRLAVPSCAG